MPSKKPRRNTVLTARAKIKAAYSGRTLALFLRMPKAPRAARFFDGKGVGFPAYPKNGAETARNVSGHRFGADSATNVNLLNILTKFLLSASVSRLASLLLTGYSFQNFNKLGKSYF